MSTTALHAAQRRAARLAELLPVAEARLVKGRLPEALPLLADALEYLEGGPLFTLHMRGLDGVLALSAAAVQMAKGDQGLREAAERFLERAVALRLDTIGWKA